MNIPSCLLKDRRRNNLENEELKRELQSLRMDYYVEIKAMFL